MQPASPEPAPDSARRGGARAEGEDPSPEEKGLPQSVFLRLGAKGVWTLGWMVQIAHLSI